MTTDQIAGRIRTWWPIFLGHIAAVLVSYVLTKTGIHVDSAVAFEVLGFLLGGAVYELGRWLEKQPSPAFQRVGRFVLSLGLDVGAPTYYGRDVKPIPPTNDW